MSAIVKVGKDENIELLIRIEDYPCESLGDMRKSKGIKDNYQYIKFDSENDFLTNVINHLKPFYELSKLEIIQSEIFESIKKNQELLKVYKDGTVFLVKYGDTMCKLVRLERQYETPQFQQFHFGPNQSQTRFPNQLPNQFPDQSPNQSSNQPTGFLFGIQNIQQLPNSSPGFSFGPSHNNYLVVCELEYTFTLGREMMAFVPL